MALDAAEGTVVGLVLLQQQRRIFMPGQDAQERVKTRGAIVGRPCLARRCQYSGVHFSGEGAIRFHSVSGAGAAGRCCVPDGALPCGIARRQFQALLLVEQAADESDQQQQRQDQGGQHHQHFGQSLSCSGVSVHSVMPALTSPSETIALAVSFSWSLRSTRRACQNGLYRLPYSTRRSSRRQPSRSVGRMK